ncbi:cilia- and flagella-associated protein 69-like isoform X2 [Scyliorhinus canicula]|uniref:cilia- and flagella-associated protein 69-like isoform X2 n=1 Tax=Scyliorhinus canicula TaxID=7830 RepID=UPI0018F4FDE7|nr:cilia- and flagella-associated protein 69-like isoform X2 [Scyliorhinus canicula]
MSVRKSIPVVRHIIRDSDLGSKADVHTRPVDLNWVINLIEDRFSCSLLDRHLHSLKRMVKQYQFGFPIRDLVQVFKILNLCAEKVRDQDAYIQPICEILTLCGLPFLKEKASDESNFAQVVSESISQMGYLLRVPSAKVRLQLCDSIIRLYSKEPPKQEFEGYYPTSKSYNMQMIEESGVVETLVMGLALVGSQPEVKLQIMQTLQCLSRSSAMNCNLMLNAQAANKICHILNDPDPSGQLLFRASEVLWNLLEQASKKELVDQLSNFECINSFKEAFLNQMVNVCSHSDRQLRNDLLIITINLAEHPRIPMIETGFTKLLIVLATFPEVKSNNPLVHGLKISSSYEDFEMKKIFFNLLVALTNDLASIQVLSEGGALLALFHYVKPHENPGVRDWSPAQFEELQLHALATLISVAPVMVDDYMNCQGNTRLLLLLDWCVSQDPYFGKGNSFHAAGGRGSKKAQMHYCLRLLRSMASLGEELINQNLHDQGAIPQLLDILKSMTSSTEEDTKINLDMQTDILIILSSICEHDIHRKELFATFGVEILIKLLQINPNKFYSSMGHNKLILSTVDCIWCCIVGCCIAEDSYIEMGGIFFLLDFLEESSKRMHNLILGTLLELCDNNKTIHHMNVWRGKNDSTAASLLLHIWKEEEKEMRVKRDMQGRILGFEHLPGLSARDYATLAIVHRYLDFKVGSIWNEIDREFKREAVHPINLDLDSLYTITKHYENLGRQVAHHQTDILENHQKQDVFDEEKMYAEMQHNHKQSELFKTSWQKYMARTTNHEILKEAKNFQEQMIESSGPEIKDLRINVHKTHAAGLYTTGFWGRLVSIETTPPELLGGPFSPVNLKIKGTCRNNSTMKTGDAGNKPCSLSVK